MPTIKPIARVVDISHYNVVEDLEQAAKFGIWGVIHKATEGVSVVDKKLEARRFLTQRAGLLWGTYHFIRAGNIASQVTNYLRVAKVGPSDLMALDWEDNKVSAAAAKDWLTRVADKIGRKPVVYSGNTAKELLRGVDPFFGSHRLWLAQYSASPSIQKSWKEFWLWQFTGDGNGPQPHHVPGIAIPGNPGMDINHYGGTKAQFTKEWAG